MALIPETGSGSSNTNSGTVTWTNFANLFNFKTFFNALGLSSTTGGNTTNGNTSSGGMSTGATNGSVNLISLPAAPIVLPTVTVPDLNGSGSNSLTGANSTNSNTFTVNGSSTTLVNNISTANNTIGISTNSGGNNSNNNTQAGVLSTGGTTLNVTVSN